jgi:hypothetical protein
MKETLDITQLQNTVLNILKSIFNMENQAMSTILIKVEKRKSPFDHLQKK